MLKWMRWVYMRCHGSVIEQGVECDYIQCVFGRSIANIWDNGIRYFITVLTPGKGNHRECFMQYSIVFHLPTISTHWFKSILVKTFKICAAFLQVKDSFMLSYFGRLIAGYRWRWGWRDSMSTFARMSSLQWMPYYPCARIPYYIVFL